MTNKDDLIKVVAQKFDLNKDESKKIIDTIFDTIVEQLDKGEEVHIAGFGKFTVKERQDKKIYNPTTKTKLDIPSHRVVNFKESKSTKSKLN